MKILILNGSSRRSGTTGKLLLAFKEELRKNPKVEIQYIDIEDMDIDYCRGCSICYRTGKCIIEDDGDAFSKAIEHADAVIFGSPTYASNISGKMKVLIDRGHFVMEQLMHGKYFISVTTFENYGGKNVIKVINNLLSFSGGYKVGQLVVKNDFNNNPLNNPLIGSKINSLSKDLNLAISNGKRYIFQKVKWFFVFNFGIKPFAEKRGSDYQAVFESWDKKGIKY
ncbi:MAG: flavodoxin family protein [Tissierellia bacterium]|nr:flavodoxin family protein [Tissierellia bacterium]